MDMFGTIASAVASLLPLLGGGFSNEIKENIMPNARFHVGDVVHIVPTAQTATVVAGHYDHAEMEWEYKIDVGAHYPSAIAWEHELIMLQPYRSNMVGAVPPTPPMPWQMPPLVMGSTSIDPALDAIIDEAVCDPVPETTNIFTTLPPHPAEITKGRFITDKERELIETRIALRKKLHGG